MVQTGDTLTRDPGARDRWGTGGSNRTIPDEFPLAANGGLLLRHETSGVLSMANAGPNTSSSQFFITLAPTPWLDGRHAIFGRVIAGIEVVRAIGDIATDASDRPLTDVLLRNMSVAGAVPLGRGVIYPARPAGTNPVVQLETSHGNVRLEVFVDKAPRTAGNFLSLVRQGYYDGMRFHRVVGPAGAPPDGFIIQAGDPFSRNFSLKDSWGTGGPNYTIPDEYLTDAEGRLLTWHDGPGILGLATRGPNTGSSQFYITLTQTSSLDNNNPVFGRVWSGMDVVRAIGNVTTDDQQRPVEDVFLVRAAVVP
jgi:cyclophilin family peptidyl-prolyl cis-trans isomerase